MTNKSVIKTFIKTITKQFTIKQLFSVKYTAVVILMTLVIAGAYFSIHKKSADINGHDDTTLNPTGLDTNQAVKNIGDVEKVVAKWVEANPKAIIDSVVAMQKKASEIQQRDAQKNVSTKKDDLFNKKSDPVHSPKGYDVVLIEFFDYNCGYCKKAQSSIEELLKQDKKVKIIFKELPILGSSSIELAKLAIAVNISDAGSYLKFHHALMKSNAKTTSEAIKIAKDLGIDTEKLQKTLESKKSNIEEQIKLNQDLASSIGINGTPAFIIGEELIPGAVDVNVLKEKISAQRKN